MLLELKVRNLGIIGEINWSLSTGLNVITGETGAGKSLVIDAVETLLAGKIDEETIRYGTGETQIEGVFILSEGKSYDQLRVLIADKGVQPDDDTLIVKCELRRQGRNIIRINGNTIPRGLLQQIGRLLVDIHGQSEHLSLLDKKYHLDFLDSYAHANNLRESFSTKAAELYKAAQELKVLAEKTKDRTHREELLRFQIDELKQAKLRDGEEEELEKERNIIGSCEKLKSLSYEAYQVLSGEGNSGFSESTLDRLNEAIQKIKSLIDLDESLQKQLQFMEDTSYELEETAREIRSYSDRLEYSPKRLEETESRLELIKSLKRKYGQTIGAMSDYLVKAEEELAGLSRSTEKWDELEGMLSGLKSEMGDIASSLSQARSMTTGKLITKVRQELKDLNMSQVEFGVSITQVPDTEGIPLPDGKIYAFNNEGIDNVEFTASTNPGEPLKPLAKIASTGEISRFMLALKGALSQADNVPVLIFDEIDIGIGGRSGETIGKKLWTLARNRQVICVTHLPQIAVFADAHFSVHKETPESRTLSRLQTLKNQSRIKELAVMLAGPRYTKTALDGALELLQNAESWKVTQV